MPKFLRYLGYENYVHCVHLVFHGYIFLDFSYRRWAVAGEWVLPVTLENTHERDLLLSLYIVISVSLQEQYIRVSNL